MCKTATRHFSSLGIDTLPMVFLIKTYGSYYKVSLCGANCAQGPGTHLIKCVAWRPAVGDFSFFSLTAAAEPILPNYIDGSPHAGG